VELRLLQIGCVLALVWVFALGVAWILDAEVAKALSGMTLASLFVGRGAGMALGYASGLRHGLVIPANLLVETVQVLILFPLFVFSWEHLIEIRALRNAIRRLRDAAEVRRDLVKRYGMVGLFVFVCSPMVMTGPVVGAAVGFLIGLKPLTNLAIVLPATALAVVGWAVVLGSLQDWAAAYNRYAPFGLVVILTLLALLVTWHQRRRAT